MSEIAEQKAESNTVIGLWSCTTGFILVYQGLLTNAMSSGHGKKSMFIGLEDILVLYP